MSNSTDEKQEAESLVDHFLGHVGPIVAHKRACPCGDCRRMVKPDGSMGRVPERAPIEGA
jgi:hypothetical protein